METQATSLLVTNIIQAGLGAAALCIVMFSIGPRIKRISSRVRRIERRMGIVTPPPGPLNVDDTGPIRANTEH